MTGVFRFDLFCRVVDNFGDAGVCWRLARQLAREYPVQVRLWIDRPDILQKICPAAGAGKAGQAVEGVMVSHWEEPFPPVDLALLPDVVVEGFGCRLPDHYVFAMGQCERPPVWINMEYLSAESWVNDCHGMASPHSSMPLTKYFFFPGFTSKTGGLFREADLLERRRRFQQDGAARAAFLERLGVDGSAGCILSLFCYDHAPLMPLFEMLARQEEKTVLCLVPEGVACASVSAFLGQPAVAGKRRKDGSLTVQVIPFTDQDDYDRLLWSCDLNFVRGEDSFLRAQWAARPFVWHIYPQDEGVHVSKLEAFFARYSEDMPPELADAVQKAWKAWNGTGENETEMVFLREMILSLLPALTEYGMKWADGLAREEDFAASLFRFACSMR